SCPTAPSASSGAPSRRCSCASSWRPPMPRDERRRKLTPPQVAARYGVSADKVLGWIPGGELRAFNAATRIGRRPRWLIDEADLLAFEQRRSFVAPPRAQTISRRQRPVDVIEFF